MSSPVFLSEFIARVRQETDTENETVRHPDATITDYINRAVKHMHAEMIKCDGQGYFEFDSNFSSVVGQEFYPLPVQVMQITKMWLFINDIERVLKGYEPTETDGMRPNMTWDGLSVNLPVYRLVGNQISLRPTPGTAQLVNFRYKGAPPKLSAPTDGVDGVSGFDEFVVFWAARRVFMKDGRTDLAGAVSADLEATLSLMQSTVRALNRGQPQRITDRRGSSVSRHYGRAWRGYWNNWR